MTPFDVGLLVVLLALSATFSGSEAALFSLDPADRERLAARGGRAGATALRLLERPRRLLITILLGNMTVNTALIAKIEALAEGFVGHAGLPVAVAISTVLLMLFGEITPQRFAIPNRRRVAVAIALPLAAMYAALRPLIDGIAVATAALVPKRGFGVAETVTEEEILTAVDDAARQGALDAPEGRLVRGVLGLDERRAADLMVPRERIVALPKETPPEGVREAFRRARFTRLPVYAGSIDNVIGVVHAKDLLPALVAGEAAPIARLLRPVTYVHKWRRADDLLRELQRSRTHLAIVVDEFGATAGLVTIENVIEAIAGRAEDARAARRAREERP